MKNNLIQYILLALFTVYSLDIFSIVGLFNGATLSNKNHLKNLSVALIAFYFLTLFISNLCYNNKKRLQIILVLISIPLSVCYAIIIWYSLYYKILIDTESISALLSTNPQETKEFLITVFDYRMPLTIAILTIPYIIIYFIKPIKINNKIISSLILIIALVIIRFTYDKRWVKREIAIANAIETYTHTLNEREDFAKLLSEVNSKKITFDNITNELNNSNKQVFIFVIGESQTRNHFSIYNYNKNTNPKLNDYKDELFIFQDVVCPAVFTNTSIEKMITFADNYNNLKGYEAGDLIQFFKDAGFKTYWLSNQYFLGPYDNLYSAIAYNSDNATYLNKGGGFFLETKYYDDALIPEVEKALQDKADKKLIIIHMMGSHTPYISRYPNDFGSFSYDIGIEDVIGRLSKQKIVATYDNSIEFTDFVLNEIISLLRKDDSESYMLFLSDHGEDNFDAIDDTRLSRSNSNIPKAFSLYEIPFILWFNDKYKQSYPNVINRVNKSLYKPYQTDRLIHTIIDLFRLKHEKFVDEDSIISDKYKEKERVIAGKKLDKK